MSDLISKVINGVIKSERKLTGNGQYYIIEFLGVCQNARNISDGKYYEHVWEQGGPYRNDSFYGGPDGGFESPEEAARAIIKRRNIVAVDAHNRIVRK